MALSPHHKAKYVERASKSPNDRFSNLPEPLIHKIMSLLPTKDSIRMSASSTCFLAACRSSPVLNFDYSYHQKTPLPDFFAFVNRSLKHRQLESPDLDCLTLTVDFSHKRCNSLGNSIRMIVNFAIKYRVRELVLSCLKAANITLPLSIFSCNSIRSIRLTGISLYRTKNFVLSCPLIEVFCLNTCCRYKMGITLSSGSLKRAEFYDCEGLERIEIEGAAKSLEYFTYLMLIKNEKRCNIINLGSCKSLKRLELGGLEINNEWFNDTVSNLVALEVLILINCGALKEMFLRNKNLQRVDLQKCLSLENVDIVAAENLEFFGASNISEECHINVGRCKNLKELILKDVKGNLTGEWIQTNFTQTGGFRFLEKLVFEGCDLMEEVKFRADHLKNMQLINCKNLRMAEIEAPNLVSFVYRGFVLPSQRLIVNSFHLDAEFHLLLAECGYENLRNFLSYFGHCKSLTLVCNCDELQQIFSHYYERINMVSPMYDLKHIILRLIGDSRYWNTVELIDNMLWFAPQLNNLSISYDSTTYVLLQLYYERLCRKNYWRENQPQNCCSSSPIKCWRHYLKNVEVEAFGGFKLDANELQKFFMDKAMIKYSS